MNDSRRIVADATLPTTKKDKAQGRRLHTWMEQARIKPFAIYRCAVCDFYDTAIGSHTPEPTEPYCPARYSEINLIAV